MMVTTRDHATPEPLLAMTTCASAEEAHAIASLLVQQRLAACVSTVSGIRSTYRWEGRVAHDTEWLLLIKTTGERLSELEKAVRGASSYDLPELIAMPITAGSGAYLRWLRAEVRGGADE